MSYYLLTLYVTTEQEEAVKDLFRSQGWLYHKQTTVGDGMVMESSSMSGEVDNLYNPSKSLKDNWIIIDISSSEDQGKSCTSEVAFQSTRTMSSNDSVKQGSSIAPKDNSEIPLEKSVSAAKEMNHGATKNHGQRKNCISVSKDNNSILNTGETKDHVGKRKCVSPIEGANPKLNTSATIDHFEKEKCVSAAIKISPALNTDCQEPVRNPFKNLLVNKKKSNFTEANLSTTTVPSTVYLSHAATGLLLSSTSTEITVSKTIAASYPALTTLTMLANIQKGIAHQPANIQEGTAHQPANIQEGIAHQPANIQKGIAHQPANIQEGIVQQWANIQKRTEHKPANIQKGIAHQPANMQKGIAHQPANIQKGIVHQPVNIKEGIEQQPANIQKGIAHQPANIQKRIAHQPTGIICQSSEVVFAEYKSKETSLAPPNTVEPLPGKNHLNEVMDKTLCETEVENRNCMEIDDSDLPCLYSSGTLNTSDQNHTETCSNDDIASLSEDDSQSTLSNNTSVPFNKSKTSKYITGISDTVDDGFHRNKEKGVGNLTAEELENVNVEKPAVEGINSSCHNSAPSDFTCQSNVSPDFSSQSNVPSDHSHQSSTSCDLPVQSNSPFVELLENNHSGQTTLFQYQKCCFCKLWFPTTVSVYEHELKEHGRAAAFKCHVCNERIESREVAEMHTREHNLEVAEISSKKKIKPLCYICGKTFSQKKHLNVHLLSHESLKKFVCNVCGALFRTKTNLNVHLESHTQEKRYMCSSCGKHFRSGSILKRHALIHTGENPWECNVCGRKFNQPQTLKGHMVTHTGMRPYQCTLCDKQFSQRGSLRAHKRIAHSM